MGSDVVEVTIAIGDTIVTSGHAAGPFAFDWAPGHVLVPPAERDVPVRTRIGLAEVTLTRVAAPERTLPYANDLDRRAWRYLAISLGVHLLMWGVATTQAPVVDRPHEHRRPPLARIRSAPPPPPPVRDSEDTDDRGAAVADVPMQLAIGGGTEEPPTPPPTTTREDAIEQARTAGVLGSSALDALTSNVDHPSSSDEEVVYGPLFGPGAETAGGFGATRSSLSPGGGCTEEPCGTIGVLHYEPIHETSNVGNGWGLMARDHIVGPTCTLHWDTVTASGDLGKMEIRRYIRDHLEQLTYCYEKELLAHPALEGELALSFLIDPSGHVQSVVASGVSPAVETCVANVIRAIEFPKVVGGGDSQVNYPLTFHVVK